MADKRSLITAGIAAVTLLGALVLTGLDTNPAPTTEPTTSVEPAATDPTTESTPGETAPARTPDNPADTPPATKPSKGTG